MSDTLFVNGRFYSLEREGEHFAALQAGPDGRLRRLFGEGEALPPVPRRVDLGGAAAVPGFIDSHVHFMAKAALGALGVNLARLEGDRIVPDCLEAVRAALAERADAGPGLVLGYALCLGAVAERRLPRASELDAWFPGRSVVVLSMDGHSSAYSGPAIDALGLRSSAKDGVLAGEAHEFNMGKLSALVLRSLGPRALARGLAAVSAEAAASGLVSIHCLEGTEDAPKDPALALFKLLGGTPGPRLRLWMQYTDPGRARGTPGASSACGSAAAWPGRWTVPSPPAPQPSTGTIWTGITGGGSTAAPRRPAPWCGPSTRRASRPAPTP